MIFSEMVKRASKFAVDNSPTILTSIGVVGTITTAYLAGKASFQAAEIIRVSDENNGCAIDPKVRMKHRVEMVWKLYIPAATTGLTTVVCIIGANHVGSRRAAGLAAAYTLTEKTFDEYKAKVVEKMGERKEEAVRDAIAQDRVVETYVDDVKIYGIEKGELCYDKWSDRYFWNTVEGIRSAENSLNYALLHDNYASASEFYSILGLPSPAYSENVGWNSDRMLEIQISSALRDGDKPVIVMDFKNEPSPDYGRFH